MNHKQQARAHLVSRLRLGADDVAANFNGVAIDLRQAANEIEDLTQEDAKKFDRRVGVVLEDALRAIFDLEDSYEPEIKFELTPNGNCRLRAETTTMLVILTVEVPRR